MTCDRTLWYAIPDATAHAAQRAFPKGNLYMTMRDVIGPIFETISKRGQLRCQSL